MSSRISFSKVSHMVMIRIKGWGNTHFDRKKSKVI